MRNRSVLVLTALVVVLLAAGGVLTYLLLDARSTARDVAAAESAEDAAHADALAAAEARQAELAADIDDAEDDTADAEERIAVADQARAAAEAQAAAVETAQAEGAAHDEAAFLDSVRGYVPGSDAELLTVGYDLCAHLDTLPYASVYDAYDRALETYDYDQALLLATAAVVMFCPEYDY
ncbi:DUF732 domain-containing protein [Blastococcus sp. SYSU D00820]